MSHNHERPASGATDWRGATSTPAKKQSEYTPEYEKKPSVRFRILPDGDPIDVGGRLAQTFMLLLEVGPRGFTAGEASPLGWARRTSAYVHMLRRLGVVIATARETAGDACVARYSLLSRIEVLGAVKARADDEATALQPSGGAKKP